MQDFILRITIALQTLETRLREERGQTSIEYLGVAVVIVALIAAVAAGAPETGKNIVNGINKQISDIL